MLRVGAAHLGCVEQPVRQIVLARARDDAGHELTVARSDRQPARDGQQLGVGFFLEQPPQELGALQQGHVVRALEIRGPEDACVAVR